MYYGDISTNSVLYWNPEEELTENTQFELTHNNDYLQWQDTFAFDNKGSIIMVTNRLQLFPTQYDFTGNSGFNFHILSIFTNSYSYMQGALNLK